MLTSGITSGWRTGVRLFAAIASLACAASASAQLVWLAQPEDQTVAAGTVARFYAACRGAGMAAGIDRWRIDRTDGTSVTLSGVGSELLVAATPADDGNRYTATCSAVSFQGPSPVVVTMDSRAATLAVLYPPIVLSEPEAQRTHAGTRVTFRAGASGNPSPAVQWQASADPASPFVDIAGATVATFALVASGDVHGHRYRAMFSNSRGSVATSSALLTIVHTVSPTVGPNGSVVPATPLDIVHGSTAAFTVVPEAGYVALVGGTCGGTLAGTNYTTLPIVAPCTVELNFRAPAPAEEVPALSATSLATLSFLLSLGAVRLRRGAGRHVSTRWRGAMHRAGKGR